MNESKYSVPYPDGWREEWGPPPKKIRREMNKRLHREGNDRHVHPSEVIRDKAAVRAKTGVKLRPFDDALKAEIVTRVANGELLSRILNAPEMPDRRAVYDMMESDQQFGKDMDISRKIAVGYMADEILEISDDASMDYDSENRISFENIARSKLRVESRKWTMGRVDPGKWGDKVQTDITSGGEKIGGQGMDPLESARQVAFALEMAKRAQKGNDE